MYRLAWVVWSDGKARVFLDHAKTYDSAWALWEHVRKYLPAICAWVEPVLPGNATAYGVQW